MRFIPLRLRIRNHPNVNMNIITKETEELVKNVWKNVDAVCFDVDSTVITEEGIDCLAEFCKKGNEVAEWTKRAMGGGIPYEIALAERLKIIKPARQQIETFLQCKPATLTQGIQELIEYLNKKKIHVYLVSGGFKSLIAPIALKLNIPSERIYANRLKFYYDGEFAGYDTEQPTSRSGGKAIVADNLKKQGYKNIVFIGDGVTDLETTNHAHAFIGFGGNVVREAVKNQSGWFVTDFNVLKRFHEKENA
ncbi:phosphoserine phosphatase [Onthophagus taurus]|uniref:phosphoserine phosphatase n=1 Tax=Onthophagus taurus TaxID=166361 RepID=UPI000C202AB2|nr:phosphoserine phosphatase [Onthophagus taurus]